MTSDPVVWWRSGLGIDPRIAGLAPMAAIVCGGIAVLGTPSGDLREGIFPWGASLAMLLLGVSALGVLSSHQPDPDARVIIGAWWTVAATGAIAVFFLAVGVGALLGIDEETDNPLALLPVLLMAFGLLSTTPALATLAVGLKRSGRLPRWGTASAWGAALPLPLVLLLGITEGTVETVGSAVLLFDFALSWIILGLATRSVGQPAPQT